MKIRKKNQNDIIKYKVIIKLVNTNLKKLYLDMTSNPVIFI